MASLISQNKINITKFSSNAHVKSDSTWVKVFFNASNRLICDFFFPRVRYLAYFKNHIKNPLYTFSFLHMDGQSFKTHFQITLCIISKYLRASIIEISATYQLHFTLK